MKQYSKHSIACHFRFRTPELDLQLCGDRLFILSKEIYYDDIN
ncbi:hypothetical protein [Tenacibaculum agarivorans]|nr:hypothetical protein [Tenacibaculum agarivorans]